jgi:MFS family permease
MNFATLLGIYLVIFIDNLGVSLLIPLLTPIAFDTNLGLLTDSSESFRAIFYGLTLGIYGLAMFLGSPFLGALSDSFGRKKTLLSCLAGLGIGYSCLILALEMKSLSLFILGRFIGGFCSGSLPVAQAALIDVAPETQRARFIGYIMFFVSLGYVLGPILGGYLSDSALFASFSLKTPFIFVTALSFINLVILTISLRETKITSTRLKTLISTASRRLLESLSVPDIYRHAALLMLMLLSWNTFFQFVGLFLSKELSLTPQDISSFMAWVGLGFAMAFLFLVQFILRYTSLPIMVGCALGLMAFAIGGVFLSTHIYALSFLAFLGAVGFGLSYSGLMAQLSLAVGKDRQGALMGVAAAIAALSAGLSGLIFGVLATISVSLPIMIAFCGMCLVALLSMKSLLKPVSA